MDLKEKALKIAERCHKGQKRENSKDDYIEHPKRVAEMVSQITDDENIICTAYLHDVIEDAELHKPRQLTKIEEEINSLNPEILENVRLLSHNGEDYQEYIKKIAKNKILRIIKICDIIDNISDNPTKKQKDKYRKALVILLREIQ
ncbi:MAG: HD domain-containing protein [Nanoarchaeota archaeon]|nr:HD domain-containing protein [Nanoarchaeota archaeon]